MDWKMFGTAFVTMFLAEFGDKTQIAAFTLTGESQKPWTVLCASSLALVLVSAIGILAGSLVGKFVPLNYLKKISALLFVGIGLWTWFKG